VDKGLEIEFQVENKNNDKTIVKALALLTRSSFENQINCAIFHISKGENRFYKVLFSGPKVTKLHPHIEKMVRDKFDELARKNADELISLYKEAIKEHNLNDIEIKEVKEDYDLWEDPIWQYL
jgi:predicted component of viral defense system (DUF524 family)